MLYKMVPFGRGLLEATNEPSLNKPFRCPADGQVGRSARWARACSVTSRGNAALLRLQRALGPARLGRFLPPPEPAAASDAGAVPAAPGRPRSRHFPRGRRQEGWRLRRYAGPGAGGDRAETELPPGVTHGPPLPAPGCCLGAPWATAAPAKGRQRPPGARLQGHVYSSKERAGPARRQEPARPPPRLGGKWGWAACSRRSEPGPARGLRPQEMAAARGEAGGDSSWRRGCARGPAPAQRLLRPARGGLRRPRAGGGKAAGWLPAEVAAGGGAGERPAARGAGFRPRPAPRSRRGPAERPGGGAGRVSGPGEPGRASSPPRPCGSLAR